MSLELAQKYRFVRFTPPLQSSLQPKGLHVGTEYHLELHDKCLITIHLVYRALNLSQQSQPQGVLKVTSAKSFLVRLDLFEYAAAQICMRLSFLYYCINQLRGSFKSERTQELSFLL